MHNAIKIDDSDGRPVACLVELDDSAFPDGAVTIDIAYSSLNYKDALAVTGSAPIARHLPMVAGIDLAGTVVESTDPAYCARDAVVATGSGLSETTWGGLSQRARLDGDKLIALPQTFSLRQTMQIGTAGFTAMLCVIALEDHGLEAGAGPVLVTGAGGGVGSVATALLARLGHEVIASTGRPQEAEYLRRLGASDIIDRSELSEPGRPLGKARWAAAVDAVGGQTLASICATLRPRAAVAACGNAGGMSLPASVAPFILRGVSLLGIDSVAAPRDLRLRAWARLANDLDVELLDEATREIGLSEVLETARAVLDGQIRGRLVVDVAR